MTDPHKPIILLITDDAAEESHTAHILAKYHFDNFLVKLRKPGDALKYFQACNAPEAEGAEALPELIIQGLRESGRLNLSPIMESRRGAVAESRDYRMRFPPNRIFQAPRGYAEAGDALAGTQAEVMPGNAWRCYTRGKTACASGTVLMAIA
jgi:hypothetical protein